MKYDGSESEFICAYPVYINEVADFLINELYKEDFITSHINKKLDQTYSKEKMIYLNKLDHNSYLREALDRIYILVELNIFTDKPEELSKFIERIINSNWSEKKILKWIEIIKETLDNWSELKPTKWQKLGNALLGILSKFMTQELVDISSEIIKDFYDWIKIKLGS